MGCFTSKSSSKAANTAVVPGEVSPRELDYVDKSSSELLRIKCPFRRILALPYDPNFNRKEYEKKHLINGVAKKVTDPRMSTTEDDPRKVLQPHDIDVWQPKKLDKSWPWDDKPFMEDGSITYYPWSKGWSKMKDLYTMMEEDRGEGGEGGDDEGCQHPEPEEIVKKAGYESMADYEEKMAFEKSRYETALKTDNGKELRIPLVLRLYGDKLEGEKKRDPAIDPATAAAKDPAVDGGAKSSSRNYNTDAMKVEDRPKMNTDDAMAGTDKIVAEIRKAVDKDQVDYLKEVQKELDSERPGSPTGPPFRPQFFDPQETCMDEKHFFIHDEKFKCEADANKIGEEKTKSAIENSTEKYLKNVYYQREKRRLEKVSMRKAWLHHETGIGIKESEGLAKKKTRAEKEISDCGEENCWITYDRESRFLFYSPLQPSTETNPNSSAKTSQTETMSSASSSGSSSSS